MSMTLTYQTSNCYLNALQKVIDEVTNPIECLVIADRDPQLIRSLSASLDDEKTAFLNVAQEYWDFSDQEFADAIEWILQQGTITNVVLAGTSQMVRDKITALSTRSDSLKAEVGYNKLLAGVERQNIRNREAASWFVSQVQELLRVPAIYKYWSEKQLQVHGLFYRVESGLFLAYNLETHELRPLISH